MKHWRRWRNIAYSSFSELEDVELEDATSFFLRREEGPASASAVSTGPEAGSGAEARSPDSARCLVGIATVTGSESVPSPCSMESTPVTFLEVLKDL